MSNTIPDVMMIARPVSFATVNMICTPLVNGTLKQFMRVVATNKSKEMKGKFM